MAGFFNAKIKGNHHLQGNVQVYNASGSLLDLFDRPMARYFCLDGALAFLGILSEAIGTLPVFVVFVLDRSQNCKRSIAELQAWYSSFLVI